MLMPNLFSNKGSNKIILRQNANPVQITINIL